MNKQSLKQNLQIFANHFLKPCSAPDEAPNIKDAVLLGGSISGLFIIVAVIWGGLAPIASASIATGVLGVEGKTRIIQHLEGGIVGEILVRNGDNVDAGQVIVRLDDTKARATYDLLSKRRMNTTTLLARLKAEQAGNSKIIFPDALVNSTNPDLQSMVSGQINLFESRRENLANQVSVLKERISEYNTEIVGLEGRIQSGERQLELTREQAGDVKALLKEGLARKPRLLELEVKASEIESRMRHNRAQIARNKTRIQGAKASISETQTKHVFNIADSLRTAESELLDMDERLRAAEDVLTRTAIVAPVSGVVTNLRVNTTGGVITPGEPVADIVPNDELLIVETRVRPDDIDIVRPGLIAHVRFTALNQRNTQPVVGVVRTISADRIVDQASGEVYFVATVELNDEENAVPADQLYPGMSAEVMIETGERSALAYLLEPVTNSFNLAFREN